MTLSENEIARVIVDVAFKINIALGCFAKVYWQAQPLVGQAEKGQELPFFSFAPWRLCVRFSCRPSCLIVSHIFLAGHRGCCNTVRTSGFWPL